MSARYVRLDARAGWRGDAVLADGVETTDGPLRLHPLPGAPRPLTDAAGTLGGLADPIGVAAAGDGSVAVLDHDGTRVLVLDRCDGTFRVLSCLAAGFALAGARDLAFTAAGDVAIADTGNGRVLVLVGAGLAVRAISTVAAEPWGITAAGTGLAVTDHAQGKVHALDGCGRERWSSTGAGEGLAPLVAPTAIAADRQGNLYVLQEGRSTVRVLGPDGTGVADLDTLDDRRHAFCPVAVAVAPDGSLCVADAAGTLCVCDRDGRRVGSVAIDAPLRGLAYDHDGQPLTVDGARACVVGLRNGAGYPGQGRFVTVALDSGLAGCRWDRVALAGTIPEGTAVRVDTLTAEAPLQSAELAVLPATRWATGQVATVAPDGSWDCAVRSAPGRHLWLALELRSDGPATPSLDAVEVWFARATSAEHLPRAFRVPEDDFLDRFLEIFDRQRATVTGRIDTMASLFDPMAAPEDFLGWLAGWVGMAFDEALPLTRRRALVREAAALHRRRGTPDGVARMVSLFCGVEVRVLEQFKLRRWAITGRARLGDTSTLFGPEIVRRLQLDEFSTVGDFRLVTTDDPRHDPFLVHAHRFSLLLLAHEDDRLLALARRVAELAKPAHTEVDLALVQPRLRVGTQSTVGLDTVVGEVPPPGRTGSARLGQGVVVGPDPRLGGRRRAQIGTRARIGVDTGLE